MSRAGFWAPRSHYLHPVDAMFAARDTGALPGGYESSDGLPAAERFRRGLRECPVPLPPHAGRGRDLRTQGRSPAPYWALDALAAADRARPGVPHGAQLYVLVPQVVPPPTTWGVVRLVRLDGWGWGFLGELVHLLAFDEARAVAQELADTFGGEVLADAGAEGRCRELHRQLVTPPARTMERGSR